MGNHLNQFIPTAQRQRKVGRRRPQANTGSGPRRPHAQKHFCISVTFIFQIATLGRRDPLPVLACGRRRPHATTTTHKNAISACKNGCKKMFGFTEMTTSFLLGLVGGQQQLMQK